MLELGIGASVVRGLSWLYLGLFALALIAAIWRPKTKPRKLGWALLVLAIFFGPLVPGIYQNYEYQQRLKVAQALFAERCKTAGEKIYRTVEGVEGVLLMNSRNRVDHYSQFDPNDPAGDEAHGIGYVESFLMGRVSDVQQTANNTRDAYRYVELVDAGDQQRYRYTGEPTPKASFPEIFEFKIEKTRAAERVPIYGVTSIDISKPEDRQVWIAGSSIKVVNLQTGEVLGERIGYIFDQALGNTSGQRAPWAYAAYTACPVLPKLHDQYPHRWAMTRNFVSKVLKPASRE